MKKETSILLKDFGIAPNLYGYKYLGAAIELVQEDESILHAVVKEMYTLIAKTYDVTPCSVERDMRHAIKRGFKVAGGTEIVKKAFGNTLSNYYPSNAHFIATMVEILKGEE